MPWSEYGKDRLPRGYSHAVARGEVERALRHAGAEIGSLSFGPPFEPGQTISMVFDVYWLGDGKSPARGPGLDRDRLMMRWNAVPAPLRSVLATQIVERWLPEACSWAADAPARGSSWRATDHRWTLWRTERALTIGVE